MRNRRVNRAGNRVILVAAAAAVIIFLLGFFMGANNMNQVEARDYKETQKYYTSVEVEAGDTLWSIADEYMTAEYGSRDEFMNEVRQMNHITGSGIRCGSTILVPYYR